MMKKMISVLLTLAMMCALGMNAFAAGAEESFYVEGHVLTQEETEQFWREHPKQARISIEATVFLPRNVDGSQGNGCGDFTADAKTVAFVITNAPNTATYNVVLKDEDGNAVSTYYKDIPINNPVSFRNLRVGTSYYFEVSSNDCPVNGCTADYEVY